MSNSFHHFEFSNSLLPLDHIFDTAGALHETAEAARKMVKLKAFDKFENTTDALNAASHLVDSKLPKGLRKFLKAQGEMLAIADSKLGKAISDKLHQRVFRRLDICINNAGVVEKGPFYEDSVDWRKVMDINLTAVIEGTKLAVQAMKGRGGQILNTASAAGFHGSPQSNNL